MAIRTDGVGNVFVVDGTGKTLFALPGQGFAVDGAQQLIYRKPGGGIEIIAPANAIRGVDAGANTLILDPARAARQSNGQPTNRITIGGSGFQRAAINGSSEQFAFGQSPPGADQSQSGSGQSQSSSGPLLPSPPPRKPPVPDYALPRPPLPKPPVPDYALPRPPLPKPPVPDYALPRPPLPKPPVPDYALPRPPLPKPPVPDYALLPDLQGPALPDSGQPLPDTGINNRFLRNFESGFLNIEINNNLISAAPPPVAGNEVGLGVSLKPEHWNWSWISRISPMVRRGG